MRIGHRLITASTIISVLVWIAASAAAVPVRSLDGRSALLHSASAIRGELIYVANANSGPVTVYRARSRGSVAPVRKVMAPPDPNAFWDPWGVTFDAAGHLFVQTFLSDATSVVFPRGAHGTTRPLRKFMGVGPDNRSIAVDSKGYEYVAGSDQPTVIVVEPPGARGKPGNLYQVPPVRTIQLDEPWTPWPSDLAVNTSNQVLAVTVRPQGNAVEIFAGGAHGRNTPVRVISGPRTGLGSCGKICSLAIAFSRLTGRIYVAVSAGARTHISVFAGSARGDARPLRTIEGPATGLTGGAVTGLAISLCHGTIYAMVHASSSGFGAARIDAYGRSAHGNAHPVRSFTDSHSQFRDSQGIAITACAP
jgi:hypothetical protein